MRASVAAPTSAASTAWDELREAVQRRAGRCGVPAMPIAGRCVTCAGPAGQGHRRCFQCELHTEYAPGLLADGVVPMAYAVKGGPHATDLWRYKSGRPGSGEAGTRLLTLLLVFLHDHGGCVWRHSGLSAGGPTHVCVVPSGRARPSPHPLQALAAPFVALPWASLRARAGQDRWDRSLDPEKFVATPLAGAEVLLLDDTWVTGASAQSATVALKAAGARKVAVVVLGRHLAAAAGTLLPMTPPGDSCAVHQGPERRAQPPRDTP